MALVYSCIKCQDLDLTESCKTLNGGQILVHIDKELPHRDGDRRVLPNQLEVIVLLRGEPILPEEQSIRLK